MDLPIIDFTKFGVQVKSNQDIEKAEWSLIGHELLNAFSSNGFAYVVNHGIKRNDIDELNEASDKFFSRPLEEKMKFRARNLGSSFYYPVGLRAAGSKKVNYNEGLQFLCHEDDKDLFNVPHLNSKARDMQEKCKILLLRILGALGIAMGLKDLFVRSHSLIGDERNMSALRTTHYPPVAGTLPDDYIRIREHRDVGSVTILFQDDIGGLQVENGKGECEDVPYVPDSIILNVGQSMEFWTGGRLKAAIHRVVVPDEPEKRSKARKSVVYFGVIDNDVLLTKLEFQGNSHSRPTPTEQAITAAEYAKLEIQKRGHLG